MTTAKPQPQTSEDADDLIAQLARLMASEGAAKAKAAEAQDDDAPILPQAEAPQPAAPQPAAAQPFSFRLPGDPAPGPAPVAPPAADKPPLSSFDPPQPFRFDFDMPRTKPAAPEAEPRPVAPPPAAAAPVQPAPQPAPTRERFMPPEPTPVAAAPSAGAPDPFDGIGELIAAELAGAMQPAPEPVPEPPVAAKPAEKPASERIDQPPVFAGRPAQPRAAAPAVETPVAVDETPAEPVVEPQPAVRAATPAQQPPVRNPAPVVAPPAARAAQPDPIADIESLIGDAVRVRLEGDAPQAAASPHVAAPPQPVVTTPEPVMVPPPAAPARPERAASPNAADLIRSATAVQTAREQARIASAEDAIIAAAAASGADVRWADPGEEALPEPEEDYEPAPVRRRGFSPAMLRPFAGPAIAVAFLVAAGVGLYSVLGSAGTPSGEPPLLEADATPVREVPPPATPSASSTASVVFNTTETAPADEQLVSRDQSDPTDIAALAAAEVSEEGLVNRRVRTLTVRPDGTIVSGDAALAGASLLPVDRPDVPEVPGANTEAPELIAAANAADALPDDALGFASTPDAATLVATATDTTPLVPGQPASAVDASGNVIAGRTAPVPMAPITRPSVSSPAPAAETAAIAPPAAAAPAAAAPPPAVTTGSTAPAYVQLSSQRTPEAAEATRRDMASRFGGLFGGAQLEIQQVDLGARGIYYRVRLPAGSLADANALCNQIKANGGDCFTI
jgi:hypothetical protein